MFMDKDELIALLTKSEDLCEELMDYYVEGNTFTMVKHPLVFSVPHSPSQNALLNKQLEFKKLERDEYLKTGDYARYVFIHEKPYRFEAFRDIHEKLPDKEYWNLLSEVWQNSENVWQNRNGWIQLLTSPRPGKNEPDAFMTPSELAIYNTLPDVVTAYRGYTPGKNMNGISYTLSKSKAEWFAKRFQNRGEGKVLTLKVPKKKIFAYLDGRNEQELIII